ncbi:unnamed protein product [Cylicocyclus nassatus]|uniref:Uncharacterized protein n=1 Tax=Cylicocyclus nassatus TaxID=53992 RepID=A0AA36DTP7_CYLNA|nr:unnamed protein product [Cylicocyclus nassatus]
MLVFALLVYGVCMTDSQFAMMPPVPGFLPYEQMMHAPSQMGGLPGGGMPGMPFMGGMPGMPMGGMPGMPFMGGMPLGPPMVMPYMPFNGPLAMPPGGMPRVPAGATTITPTGFSGMPAGTPPQGMSSGGTPAGLSGTPQQGMQSGGKLGVTIRTPPGGMPPREMPREPIGRTLRMALAGFSGMPAGMQPQGMSSGGMPAGRPSGIMSLGGMSTGMSPRVPQNRMPIGSGPGGMPPGVPSGILSDRMPRERLKTGTPPGNLPARGSPWKNAINNDARREIRENGGMLLSEMPPKRMPFGKRPPEIMPPRGMKK